MKKIQNWVFKKIHGNSLVYNTCWEDPRCDRTLLELDKKSEVVMITSAGCNALAYLLDKPDQIHCVDMNARQNALLELKKAFYKTNDYNHLFQCFGDGSCPDVQDLYEKKLRDTLPDFTKNYWDKKIKFFNGKGIRKSFYYHGTSGILAWSFGKYLKIKKSLYKNLDSFFQAANLEQQAFIYQQIENKLWSEKMGWFFNSHLVMSMAGVPKSQQQLFITKYENGAVDFIKNCMNNVFVNLPVNENYFWYVYFKGSYTQDCCPAYLKENNFSTISDNINKIRTYTTTVSDFLKKNPKEYSHFVLLDHQDWLAENNKEALVEEWQLILKNSRPGTKILLRSAADEINYFPPFVTAKIDFNRELASRVHLQDRVGTYASTYIGTVK
ncbi:MAG: BtaA family protein [Bacteroidota bacterium]